MSLKLYFHPLSSFCQKVLIALYENDTPFEPHMVDLGDEASRAAFLKVWPIGQFPVLRDDSRDCTIPESSVIIEYLHQHHPGRTALLPDDAHLAWQVRLWDRFCDLHVNVPMQKIVTDRRRPAGCNDPYGVEQAKARLQTAYAMIDERMATRTWATGDDFSMADCAAAPALFYANKVVPFGEPHQNVAQYFQRLLQRPSYTRALQEAQPYFKLFPSEAKATAASPPDRG
jgi:glutathione S-transferase